MQRLLYLLSKKALMESVPMSLPLVLSVARRAWIAFLPKGRDLKKLTRRRWCPQVAWETSKTVLMQQYFCSAMQLAL